MKRDAFLDSVGRGALLLDPANGALHNSQLLGQHDPEFVSGWGYYQTRNGWTVKVERVDRPAPFVATGVIEWRNPSGYVRKQPGVWRANGRYMLAGEHPLDLVAGPSSIKP